MEQIEVEPSRSVGQVVGVRTPVPQVQSRKYRVGRSEKWSAFGQMKKMISSVDDDSSRRSLPFARLFALSMDCTIAETMQELAAQGALGCIDLVRPASLSRVAVLHRRVPAARRVVQRRLAQLVGDSRIRHL